MVVAAFQAASQVEIKTFQMVVEAFQVVVETFQMVIESLQMVFEAFQVMIVAFQVGVDAFQVGVDALRITAFQMTTFHVMKFLPAALLVLTFLFAALWFTELQMAILQENSFQIADFPMYIKII